MKTSRLRLTVHALELAVLFAVAAVITAGVRGHAVTATTSPRAAPATCATSGPP